MFSIPSGIFTKYAEVADYMLTSECFGTSCQLVYASKIVVSTNDDLRQRRTMKPSGGNRGDELTEYVETTENVTLRVYYDKKSFYKVASLTVPDGGCMTICSVSLRQKLDRASFLLTNTEQDQPWKYEKASEIIPWGLDKQYIVCAWARV